MQKYIQIYCVSENKKKKIGLKMSEAATKIKFLKLWSF